LSDTLRGMSRYIIHSEKKVTERIYRFLPYVLASLTLAAAVGAVGLSRYGEQYPYARIVIQEGIAIEMEYFFTARSSRNHCETMLGSINSGVLSVCPFCKVIERTCTTLPSPRHEATLSAAPIDAPSIRLAEGSVMVYRSTAEDAARTICIETAKQINSLGKSGAASCFPAAAARPPAAKLMPPWQRPISLAAWFLALLSVLGFAATAFVAADRAAVRNRLSMLPRSMKRLIILGTDAVLVAAALSTALFLRHGTQLPAPDAVTYLFPAVLLITLATFFAAGLYRSVTRYIDSRTGVVLFAATACSTVLIYASSRVLEDGNFTLLDTVFFGLLTLLYIGGTRFAAREYFRRSNADTGQPNAVIIYGAGHAGAQLAISLKTDKALIPVAFVDDNPDLAGSSLYGVRIYSPSQLLRIAQEFDVRQVLLAVPSATKQDRKRIFDLIEPMHLRIRTIPSLSQLVEGRSRISDIEDVHIEDLLGRDPVPPVADLLAKCITGKVVLVTGAGGSIGSELCRQILALSPAKLVLLDQSEYALYNILEELRTIQGEHSYSTDVIPILASIVHKRLLDHVIRNHGVKTIYHAAAYKHVPLVESNPLQAIINNVIGSLRAAESAIDQNVETFVLISTDKAVRPTSIMGASKRMAELIMQGISIKSNYTRFCMVRFGNVLESSGSVVPLFRKQILTKGPVTVTHPDITRYFMTIPEAAQLVIQAGSMAKGGDVFVLDMGEPVKILDLARRLIHLSGLTIRSNENTLGDIEIKFTGLRPGEKLYEELLIGNDTAGTEHPLIRVANEESVPWDTLSPILEKLVNSCNRFDTGDAIFILKSVVPISSNTSDERDSEATWNRIND